LNGKGLNRSWRVIVADCVRKQIRRFPRGYAAKIRRAIDEMEDNPFLGDIRKLSGEQNVFRRRVGNFRVIFEVLSRERVVLIYDIRRRTSSTY